LSSRADTTASPTRQPVGGQAALDDVKAKLLAEIDNCLSAPVA